MKASKKLKQRIEQLENEQSRQEDDIHDLDSLRNLVEIEALEKELFDINQDSNNIDILASLDDIDLDFDDTFEANEMQIDNESSASIENINLATINDNISHQKGAYVVGLLFNQDKPSEWSEESGGGWRGPGMGTHYETEHKAKQIMQQLQRKWPDYPIKILS